MGEFKTTEATKAAMPTFTDTLSAFAFAQTEEFISAGQSVAEAASVTANIMIRVAWIVASSGVIAEGKEPNPDNFREAVEDQLKRVQFAERAEDDAAGK